MPPSGRESADIMIVGEAPGKDEEAAGEPFVGKSGQFLRRYLGRAGVKIEDVYLTNLCPYRPKGNAFQNARGTVELENGLLALSAQIEKVNPNLIVAVGAWPMYYLTGCISPAQNAKAGSGISNWRGSVMPGVVDHIPSALGRKVLITYHPAFIIRPEGFGQHPIFYNDLQRIPQESESRELNYPRYAAYIDPPNLPELVEDMLRSEWLTVDIETFGESLACVGFADSTERGLCITFQNPHGWDLARRLLDGPGKKIMQYGTFDINYLKWFYGWDVANYAFDTYIAAANLMPEFKRGLDFLTSIYTRFPFYKEERKIWKLTGNLQTYWEYNIKDVIATHTIAMEQMKELEELYGS